MIKLRVRLEDFLSDDGDIDVIDDVTDDLWIAKCGAWKLTEEGKKHFRSVLPLKVEYMENWEGLVACVLLDHRKDWERLERKCIELFEALAGYCSESDFKKWFIEL